MLDREAIEKIEELSKANLLKVEERTYSDKKLHEVLNPIPSPLILSSLTGLVDYIKTNVDQNKMNELLVHVVSHDHVNLHGPLDPVWKVRPHLLAVNRKAHGDGFKFGVSMDAESFVIGLQANFVPTDNTLKLLRVAGNMRAENSVGTQDDGFSQSVEVKAGVALAARADVPNPVALAPYRSFIEIEQPSSDFVFRVHQDGANRPPRCSLHEADGGRWRIEAIHRIRDFLSGKVGGVAIIA